ncbi:MAG: hypothetical protein JNL80_18410 [Phycisphaerae bacterium]|nr:hypothetical protein [Phycisphaerae bacterium]
MSDSSAFLVAITPDLVGAILAAIALLAARRLSRVGLRGPGLLIAGMAVPLYIGAHAVTGEAMERRDRIAHGSPEDPREFELALERELADLRQTGLPSRRLQRMAFEIGSGDVDRMRRLTDRMLADSELAVRSRELSNALADGFAVAVDEGRLAPTERGERLLRLSPYEVRVQKRVREGERLPMWIAEVPGGMGRRQEEWPDYPRVPRNRHSWRSKILAATLISTVRQELRVYRTKDNTATAEMTVARGSYLLDVTWATMLIEGTSIVAQEDRTDRVPVTIVAPHEAEAEFDVGTVANPFVAAHMEASLHECGEGWGLHLRLGLKPRIRESLGLGSFTLHFGKEAHTVHLGSSDDLTLRPWREEGRSFYLGRMEPIPADERPLVELHFENHNESRYVSPIKEIGWSRPWVVTTTTARVVPLPERWWLATETGE